MFWLLFLIPAAPYSARLVFRSLRKGELQKRDRAVLGVLAAWITIAASAPWVILTSSRVHINSLEELYWRGHMTWPVVALHACFVIISIAMGLWLTFSRGAEFVVRHRGILLVPITNETVVRQLGWVLLCYPVIYLVVLEAVSR